MRLIVMRHASAGEDPKDHGRPLTVQGVAEAEAIGDWLRARTYLPGLVLCSDARRTRETHAALRLDAPARFEPRLYNAPEDTILDVLAENTAESVLVIGHNPGIGAFATAILKTVPERLRGHYPAAGTLITDLPGDQPRFGTGTFVDFASPKDPA